MTITFSFAREIGPGHISAVCPAAEAHRVCHGTCGDPVDIVAAGACDCAFAERAACTWCGMAVTLSNGRGLELLEKLGLPVEHTGMVDPHELYGRAATAMVGRDDSGDSGAEDVTPGGARMVYCGTPEGYFTGKCDELAKLAGMADFAGGLWIVWS